MTQRTTTAQPNGHTPYAMLRAAEFERLADLETDECVIWPYARDKRGYGKLVVRGKVQRTHRLALLRRSDPPPDRPHACHQPGRGCVKACFNYRHLRWATPAENNADKVIDGTDPKGERHGGHKLTEVDVREIRSAGALTAADKTDLAHRYGISAGQICAVLARRSWGWLE